MPLTRRGITLVELLTALVVTSLLASALFRLVDSAQRFTRGSAELADQRAQLAVATFAVESELQAVAPRDGDLLSVSDSAVAYHGSVGSAVTCNVGVAALDLAPPVLASGAALTWWNSAPQPADSLLVFDEGARSDAGDDRWWRAALRGVSALPDACLHTPFLDSIADAGKSGWRLIPSLPLPSTVTAGAPVLVVRPRRFALYRSSGEWMLGWSEWNWATGAWQGIQPVAGPLLAHATPPGASGFALAWRDSTGAAATPLPGAPPWALALTLRGTTRRVVRMDGMATGAHRDSLTRHVTLRNAP